MASTTTTAERGLQAASFVLFFLSGCAGLIYQSIWSQYLGLFMGHAAYAQCLVLAIFMGGMAIGAIAASRVPAHWANLLRLYAYAELLVGLAAIGFHVEFTAATGFAYDRLFPALGAPGLVDALKWTLGAVMILPQSIVLGATFPLMSDALMRRLQTGSGEVVSSLYFTNSMGAAFGSLLATFVLLPWFGLPGAMRFGGFLSLLVGLCAFLLSRNSERIPASGVAGGRPIVQESRSAARLLLVSAFVTGATSFVYEIGWVRMLSLAFGTTLHAFELMLAAFVGGLALGGLWIRKRIDGVAEPIRFGGHVQVLMGIAALVSLLLYARAFDWVAWVMGVVAHNPGGYALFNTLCALAAIVIMTPAAFFAGMTLPLFTLALIRRGGGEASVGGFTRRIPSAPLPAYFSPSRCSFLCSASSWR